MCVHTTDQSDGGLGVRSSRGWSFDGVGGGGGRAYISVGKDASVGGGYPVHMDLWFIQT